MGPVKENDGRFSPDALSFVALDFLERSRDVANEVVVDGTRRETSTSRRDEATAIDSGAVVR
jgi:hypothetical protein